MRSKGSTRGRFFAISMLVLSFALVLSAEAFAGVKAGSVTHLSGPLFAKKADRTIKVLTVDSVVELGDTLVTEKKTYAKIQFTDNGVMILRPNSQFKVSDYQFEETAPARDKVVFNLVRGGVRSITGKIGKRGNIDSYKLMTETATAGIRGTTFEARICEGDCGSLPNGLYFFVVEGTIVVTNEGGSKVFSVGQYAYVKDAVTIPMLLPENPGIDFSLPLVIETGLRDGDAGNADRGCKVR